MRCSVLLVLSRHASWSSEIRAFIATVTNGHLGVDEQSLHRALRRVEAANLITHTTHPAPGTGAKRKVYELTQSGERMLAALLRGPLSYVDNPTFREAAAAAAGRPPTARLARGPRLDPVDQ